MLAVLEFVFSSFWVFCGTMMLGCLALKALAVIGRLLVAMVALIFGRNANIK